MDKYIVGGIVFYKYILLFILILFSGPIYREKQRCSPRLTRIPDPREQEQAVETDVWLCSDLHR